MKHYIFCIKDDVITPISLAEENVGEIITALLKQQFFISPLQIMAESSATALINFNGISQTLGIPETQNSTIH